MPYNIGDTGPAAYDLQRRQLAQERNNALLRQTLEMLQFGLQGKMQEQARRDEQLKWSQQLAQQGVENQQRDRQLTATEGYYKLQEGRKPTESDFDVRFKTAQESGMFGGDVGQQAAWAANPNYRPPVVKPASVPKTAAQIEAEAAARARGSATGRAAVKGADKTGSTEKDKIAELLNGGYSMMDKMGQWAKTTLTPAMLQEYKKQFPNKSEAEIIAQYNKQYGK